ncbi:MAG TPA: hypothetical protein VIL71_19500 [Spirillospora sp.]
MADDHKDNEELETLPENDRSGADLRATHQRLREMRREFRAAARNTAYDGDAFGGDKVLGDKISIRSGGEETWHVAPVPLERRHDVERRFVDTPTREKLIRVLDDGVVAVLRGRPGTGRRTAALAALAHRHRELRMIGSGEPPAHLGKDELAPGHGYLYDASGLSWARRPTEPQVLGCSTVLAALNARLVIVVDGNSDTSALPGLVIDHRPPDVHEVLRRQLADRLAGVRSDIPEIIARITDMPTDPKDAGELAADLAEGLRAGRPVEDVRANRPSSWRRKARKELRQEDDDRDLGRRAFVIAGAVLGGLPTVQVCRAAYDLAVLLFEIEKPGKDAKLALPPLEHMLDTWLRPIGEEQPHPRAMDRTLSIRRELVEAVLDSVWLDYVVSHRALLSWLSQLARDHDPGVRMKAAQAVARFAAYDFDFVYEHCIRKWADSKSEALHLAAAWALEAVVVQRPQRHHHVADLLWTWSRDTRPGGIGRQSTAVRLCGTILGNRAPAGAMDTLREIAHRRPFTLRSAICDAVVELYAGGGSPVVVRRLLAWVPSRALGPLVPDCLTRMAQLPHDGRPPLLAHYDADPVLIGTLWRQVLLSPHCGQGPWNALREWAKDGVPFDALRDDLCSEPGLRPRMRFYGLALKERTA